MLPNQFTAENYPNSMMTQVIGINNSVTTDGFYVDQAGVTHGFYHTSNGIFTSVDYPRLALQPAAEPERYASGFGLLQLEHRQHHP